MGEMDEIVVEFLIESKEGLDLLDADLVALEERPTDRELLARIFRCTHTIKGTSGFLGFKRLESVTHAGESLLSRLRDGELQLTPEMTNGLLAMVDAVREMLCEVEVGGNDGDGDYGPLVARLTALTEGQESESAEAPPPPAPVLPLSVTEPPIAVEAPAPEESPDRAHEVARGHEGDPRGGSVAESIRVDVNLIDKLMDLVGELVLTRNQILQSTSRAADSSFQGTSQRLNIITSELQGSIMRMRMQPIDNVLSKFPRLVRDLARHCQKNVRIDIDGKNTELDKTLIEAIKDPLTHLLRNAVDHGIEPPDQRVARGKSAEGRILVRAFHEGGQVNIEISDDGAGIPVDRIRQKAIDRGLVRPEDVERLGEREVLNFIFLPGFSTATKVTEISGRGVGMDVVKTNVEKIGGTIDIQSQPGHGTTFRIKIPLTLAIIPALIVTAGGNRYAIPQVNLVELVRLEGERAHRRVERIHGAPVYRLRGSLLPLVFLDRELGLGDRVLGPEDAINIVVLQADSRQFGLVVERIIDTQEIVVKPLAAQIKGISAFAGATILGDGRVALILDVLGLAQRAHVVSDAKDRGLMKAALASLGVQADRKPLLLFSGPDDGRMAWPLERVERIEAITESQLEAMGDTEVIQYRGEIMPLSRVSDLLPERRARPRAAAPDAGPRELSVIVSSVAGRSVGVVVGEILDIVEEPHEIKRAPSRPGVVGSVVIHERVTEILDVDWVLKKAGALLDDGAALEAAG